MRIAHVLLGFACALALTTASVAKSRDPAATNPEQTLNRIMNNFDADIARLKANLQLTGEQDKNWGAFQTALHDMAAARAKAWLDRQQEAATPPSTPTPPAAPPTPSAATTTPPAQPAGTATPPATPAPSTATASDDGALAELRAQADQHAEKADNLRKLADALQPLYVTLDARQRRTTLQFLPRYWASMYANAGE